MRELGITYTAEERRRLGLPRFRRVTPEPEALTLTDAQRARLAPAELATLPVAWLMTLADIRALREEQR